MLALTVFFTSSLARAEEIVVERAGPYKDIKVQLEEKAVNALANGDKKQRAQVIEAVKSTPERYAPVVFYEMSRVLFQDGKKDEGAFWFYAGQLRARYDANRCLDESAKSAVAALNQEYGEPINRYTFADPAKLEALVMKVFEWDKNTPHQYDHRWINLSGMDAMMAGLGEEGGKAKALSAPKSKWPKILEKTRAEYLSGFKEALAELKKQKAAQ